MNDWITLRLDQAFDMRMLEIGSLVVKLWLTLKIIKYELFLYII